jgi:hypothetical protein
MYHARAGEVLTRFVSEKILPDGVFHAVRIFSPTKGE